MQLRTDLITEPDVDNGVVDVPRWFARYELFIRLSQGGTQQEGSDETSKEATFKGECATHGCNEERQEKLYFGRNAYLLSEYKGREAAFSA